MVRQTIPMVHNLRLAGYIFLFCAAFSAVLRFSNYKQPIFWTAIFIILWIFSNVLANSIKKNGELLNGQGNEFQFGVGSFSEKKAAAVKYCTNLIEYYKKSQKLNRTSYYIVQLSIIIFSGITPVLIVIGTDGTNKNLGLPETRPPWITWLSIILPALAAILASISTSIPLQKNWISSKITKENLEAEFQAFKLNATDLYRVKDASIRDDITREYREQEVLDTFIDRVNKIHLQEVTQWAQLQLQKDNEAKGSEQLQQDEKAKKKVPETPTLLKIISDKTELNYEETATIKKKVPETPTLLKIISDKTELNYEETATIKVESGKSVKWSANPKLGSFEPEQGFETVYTAPTEEEAKDSKGDLITRVTIIATSVDATNSQSSLLIAIPRNS